MSQRVEEKIPGEEGVREGGSGKIENPDLGPREREIARGLTGTGDTYKGLHLVFFLTFFFYFGRVGR